MRSARSVMSSRLPMGVATTYKTPNITQTPREGSRIEDGGSRDLRSAILYPRSSSLAPIPRIAEIAVDGALRHLGDHRQAAFELGCHDLQHDPVDERLVETERHQLRLGAALIDHHVKQLCHPPIGK